MEEALGTQLGEVWDTIDLQVKLKIVEDIVALERKLLSVSFTRLVVPFISQTVKSNVISICPATETSTLRMMLFKAVKRWKFYVTYHIYRRRRRKADL
jgi:hypothetical protein